MDWLKSIAEFIRTWQTALALFGGGATAIAARSAGHVKSDLEFTIAFLSALGFWMLIAMVLDASYRAIRKRLRMNRIAAKQQIGREKAAKVTQAAAELQVRRAVGNIDHLQKWEADALAWIYHQPGQRARASIHHVGIDGLVILGLLAAEDRRQPSSDRVWFIPPEIVEAIRSQFGEPDASKGKQRAPWLNQRV
ncbi:MAG: hypothetical protein K2Y71_04515 [Xanthobacteraceae bacterium]|nr:hypothetical protein [Xanthobacteraceae bacterium]